MLWTAAGKIPRTVARAERIMLLEEYNFKREVLEDRITPVALDLTNIAGTATVQPLGIQMANPAPAAGTGYSVALVHNSAGTNFDDLLIGAPSLNTVPPVADEPVTTVFDTVDGP